jgi:hypothetical protein
MLDEQKGSAPMSRVRFLVGCLMLITSVASILPGAASAEEPIEHKFKEYEKTTELGNEKLEGTVGSLRIDSYTMGIFITTECTTNTLEKAEMIKETPEDEMKGTIKAEKCTLYELAGGKKTAFIACTVKTPVTLSFQGNLSEGTWSPIEEYQFNATRKWGTFEVTGTSCTLKGSYPTSYTNLASLPNGEIEQSEHEIVFPWVGSPALEFGEIHPATFIFTMKVKRTNGKPWYYA